MHTLTRERQQDAETEALAKSAKHLSADLLAALRLGDLAAPAQFAPMVAGWCLDGISVRVMRHQTVSEVMQSEINGTDTFDALLKLVCRMAYSADDRSVLAAQARTLLNNIAADFGDNNATEEK